MADLLGKLVVRSHAPKRRAVLLASGVLLAPLLLYGAFELGRHDAGFRVLDRLTVRLAGGPLARRVDREGYKQVERSLGDMQSQIARLNQDLSFYRGLVQPETLVHVKVQQMQIVPEGAAGQFRLKFVLMQTGKPVRN